MPHLNNSYVAHGTEVVGNSRAGSADSWRDSEILNWAERSDG